jgi:hypothetical protein
MGGFEDVFGHGNLIRRQKAAIKNLSTQEKIFSNISPMKAKVSINLDPQIVTSAEKCAKISGISRAEYLAGIIEWWYGQNSPPISNADARLRNEKTSLKRAS